MGICSGEGDNYNSILNPSSENKASGLKVSSKAKFECMGADKKKVFLRLTDLWGRPEIGCFASRTMRKLPQYMSLNPDPDCIATNALYQEWENFPFFPPFCLIRRVLKLIQTRSTQKAIVIVPM